MWVNAIAHLRHLPKISPFEHARSPAAPHSNTFRRKFAGFERAFAYLEVARHALPIVRIYNTQTVSSRGRPRSINLSASGRVNADSQVKSIDALEFLFSSRVSREQLENFAQVIPTAGPCRRREASRRNIIFAGVILTRARRPRANRGLVRARINVSTD